MAQPQPHMIQPLISRGNILAEISGETGTYSKLLSRTVDMAPFPGNAFGFNLPDFGNPPPQAAPAGYVAHDGNTNPLITQVHSVYSLCYMRTERPNPAKTLLMAEAMIPGYEHTKWLQTAEARNLLRSTVNGFIRRNGLDNWDVAKAAIPFYTDVAPAAAVGQAAGRVLKTQNDINNDPRIAYKELPNGTITGKMQADGSLNVNSDFTIQECTWILGCCGAYENRSQNRRVREALCELIIAFCKQGNCAPAWLRRAAIDLSSNFGDTIDLEKERILEVYALFNNYSTEQTLEYICDSARADWAGRIAAQGIRLKTIITQAAGTGTTAIQMIGEAFKKYPDFPWDAVTNIVPVSEFQAARQAANVMTGRKYIGFNSTEMKNHGVSKYRKLAWVARDLLQTVDGQDSLTMYKGVPETIPGGANIHNVVQTYAATKTQIINVAPGAQPSPVITAAIDNTNDFWGNIFA
ncbi:putative nucleoprotein [Freshwater macrophyte associated chu-like virus 1]|nr:putative nucleoprotein [Freshwater macrophyte associated chu-like virus 1]